MCFIADWALILISSCITVNSYKRIVKNKCSSIAHFIVLVEYVFLCIPILLNYCIGIPTYNYISWYKSFLPSMESESIAFIYDMYILVSIILLYCYARSYDRRKSKYKKYEDIKLNGLFNNRIFLTIVIVSPIIYIILSGKMTSYLIYASSGGRGIEDTGFTTFLSMLILFSIYAFCYQFFTKPVTKGRFLILLLYSFAISWINGKRFIIALMLIVYLFFYTRSDLSKKTRKKLEIYTPFLFVALVLFSYYYLVVIKPLSDVSFNSVYDMLRVDFGRDDVIKYVINKELFQKSRILDYRGETFLSTFLTFVPRAIWPNKPYPHYMYLTASILGTSIDKLPAGTTPSWFEMCIANCSWLGFVIGIVFIPILCKWCDRLKSIPYQMLMLVFIIVLVTQSTDAYVGFLVLIIVQFLIAKFIGKGRLLFNNKKCR
ncbi:Uncharacterised protein [Coprococcus eutactus]|jgi:hypothetical protein|nr:Uncharacterised protein [Coprococcus eutactus]